MPEIISCPGCERKIRVADALLGKRIKCPGCTTSFTANSTAEEEEVPEQEEEETPVRNGKRSGGDHGLRSSSPERRSSPRDEEDEDEAPRKRRRREEEDEEEDDAPRKRKGRHEDDEEEDAPRARKRRREDDDEDDEDDRPRSRRRHREDDEDEDDGRSFRRRKRRSVRRGGGGDWGKVRLGLTFALVSVALSVAACLAIGLLFVILAGTGMGIASAASAGDQGGVADSAVAGGLMMILVMILWGALSLGSLGTNITGLIFDIFAPSKKGAKVLAIVALSLTGAGLLFSLLHCGVGMGGYHTSYGSFASPGVDTFSTLGNLLAFAGFVVFLFFLWSVCRGVHDEGMARGVIYLICALGAVIVVSLLLFCVTICVFMAVGASLFSTISANGQGQQPPDFDTFFAAAGGAAIFSVLMAILVVLLWLAWYIWYVITLFQVRGAVTTHLEGRRD